jgi:LuxR family transcriptional regulator, maltose regulon positive regulatory protein
MSLDSPSRSAGRRRDAREAETKRTPNVDPMVVLRAKLRAPQVRPEWVARGGLLDALKAARDRRLVLIDAPVGYGKSTLISQWSSTEAVLFAWLSLDPADNDPVRFWTYTIEAIRNAGGRVDVELLNQVRAPQGLRSVVIPRLLNDLEASSERLVLVLDDYHLIRNNTCHELVNLLLENLPHSIQLVVATRSDPPLRLGRLRVQGDVFEVRASQLRFDVDETQQLLKAVLGRPLEADQAAALVERTEGWPAGIYLAAMSMRGRDDVPRFLQEFSGSSRLLADYLTMEVVQRQRPDVRQFLIRTSILERFTAGLTDEVVGVDDSVELLHELERSNLFVVPLDERREWYRYHHLFKELLYSELRRSDPAVIPELHRRAAQWHRRNGHVGQSVHHAISAGDISTARDLIWVNLLPYINRGRIQTVDGWLSRLGHDSVASDPLLSLAAGWIAALSGRLDEVQEWLAAAEQGTFEGPLPDETPSLAAGILLLRATFGHDGVSQALQFAREAVDADSHPRSAWRPLALFTLGTALSLSGDFSGAQAPLQEASKLSHGGQPVVQISALSQLSLVHSYLTDTKQARTYAVEAITVMNDLSLQEIPQTTMGHAALGRVLIDEGDLTSGIVHLEKALAIRSSYPQLSPWPTLQILVDLAPAQFALGDRPGAEVLMQRARAILDFHPDAGILADQVVRLERSLAPAAQRPALFGERLTDRELSVLRLLPSHLTHREIGESLFISLNTVKSHVRTIYQKLTVSARIDAVNKARELGLL